MSQDHQEKEKQNHPVKKTSASPAQKTSADNDVVFYHAPQKSQKSATPLPQRSPRTAGASATPANPQKTSPQKKLTKKRVAFNAVASVLASLMILGGAMCLVVYTYFHRINYQAISESESSTSSVAGQTSPDSSKASDSESKIVKPYAGNLLEDPMVLNIMLFGADTREGSDVGNSDTMVLFSIDTRHNKLKMLSFMRDTFVEIPGYDDNRINASYSLGGPALSVSTIQKNFGIKIDRYAVVDFSSFRNIIDILGGIDVPLTEEEVDYINWQYWINEQEEYRQAEGDYKETVRANLRSYWISSVPESEKPVNKNTLSFQPNGDKDPTAVVHLNGRQALWHARNRGEDDICSGSDFTRTERQRNVLSIIINGMRKADIGQVVSIIYEIGPLITTNVKSSEITALAANVKKYLSYDIVSESAPAVNELGTTWSFSDPYERPVYIGGYAVSVIIINDWDEFRQKVAEFVYEEQVRKPGTTQ